MSEDPQKTEPGECGCGVVDADSDGDGTLGCRDGCPDDRTKTEPGVCGCGVQETDVNNNDVSIVASCDDFADPDGDGTSV